MKRILYFDIKPNIIADIANRQKRTLIRIDGSNNERVNQIEPIPKKISLRFNARIKSVWSFFRSFLKQIKKDVMFKKTATLATMHLRITRYVGTMLPA